MRCTRVAELITGGVGEEVKGSFQCGRGEETAGLNHPYHTMKDEVNTQVHKESVETASFFLNAGTQEGGKRIYYGKDS